VFFLFFRFFSLSTACSETNLILLCAVQCRQVSPDKIKIVLIKIVLFELCRTSGLL